MSAFALITGILWGAVGMWAALDSRIDAMRAEIARLTATKQGRDSLGRFVSKGVGE